MNQLLYLVPMLICPIAMGLMMWFMMRKPGSQPTSSQQPPQPATVADPRDAELARLRADLFLARGRADHPASTDVPVPAPR